MWAMPVIVLSMLLFYPLIGFLFRLAYKRYLVDFLCRVTGFSFNPSGFLDDETLFAHRIPVHPIAWSHRHKHEDGFSGEIAGVPCTIQEVVYAGEGYAKRPANNFPRDAFVWRWVFVHIKSQRRHNAHTLIVPERSTAKVLTKTLDGLSRVQIVSGEFESRYEVFSSDQVESRAYLTPDRIEACTALAQDLNMNEVQMSLRGSELLICFRSINPLVSVPKFSVFGHGHQDMKHLKQSMDVFLSDLRGVEHILQQMGVAKDTKSTTV